MMNQTAIAARIVPMTAAPMPMPAAAPGDTPGGGGTAVDVGVGVILLELAMLPTELLEVAVKGSEELVEVLLALVLDSVLVDRIVEVTATVSLDFDEDIWVVTIPVLPPGYVVKVVVNSESVSVTVEETEKKVSVTSRSPIPS